MTKPKPVEPHPVLPQYYADQTRRPTFVRELFDQTAQHYDGINRKLSLGSGGWYRHRALLRAGLQLGMSVLDVATGTGLVAREAVRITGSGNVIGLDVSPGMLQQASLHLDIRLIQGVVEQLPIAEQTFHFVSMGYALRHAADLIASFRELHRVLRPGGTLLILEISRPRGRLQRALTRLYLGRLIPLVSRCSTGDREAQTLMRYYWDTIEHCVPAPTILEALREAGFTESRCQTELAIFNAYTGIKT